MMSDLETLLESWERQFAEGEARFCPQAIDEIRAAFFTYQRGLDVVRENAQAQLLAKVEGLVAELNAIGGLDGRHRSLLETDEREELVPLILRMARQAGLELKPDDDPTAATRSW